MLFEPLNAIFLGKLITMKPFFILGFVISHLSSFGQITSSFSMDYGMVDKIRAEKLSTTERLYSIPLNTRYQNSDAMTVSQAAVLFDSLLNPDFPNLQVTYYPRATTQLNLDSIDVYLRHSNITHNYDSLWVTVFWLDSFKILNPIGLPHTASLYNNAYWDTLMVINSSLPKNVLVQGIPTYTKLTLYPNVGFPKGKSFGIRISFTGDTANKCELLTHYRDDCSGGCIGEKSAAGLNSWYYFNLELPTKNYCGINEAYADCNANEQIDVGSCEEFYAQNWWIVPCVTVEADTSFIQTMDTISPEVLPHASFTHNCTGNIYSIRMINTSVRDTGHARWIIRLHTEFSPYPDTISYHVGDTIFYSPIAYNINGSDINTIYVTLIVSNEYGQDTTTARICLIDWEDINETILSDISIFPNPLNETRFQISGLAELRGNKVEITDANGRIIYHSTITQSATEIELDAARGVYFLRIYSEKVSIVKRLVRL